MNCAGMIAKLISIRRSAVGRVGREGASEWGGRAFFGFGMDGWMEALKVEVVPTMCVCMYELDDENARSFCNTIMG